jgi:hypothetical protein
MQLALSTRADTGMLLATYRGTFDLREAKKTFLQILDALEQRNARKVVVDGRALTGQLSPSERFAYGEFVAKEVNAQRSRIAGYAPQFAYVLNPPVLDPERLGENVAVNRGMHVKAFDNLDDALDWLGIDERRK